MPIKYNGAVVIVVELSTNLRAFVSCLRDLVVKLVGYGMLCLQLATSSSELSLFTSTTDNCCSGPQLVSFG